MPKVKHLKLDFSAWSTYKLCPKAFEHEYLLGFKSSADPLNFGQVMHAGLEAFHEKSQEANIHDLEFLLDPLNTPDSSSPLDVVKQKGSELLRLSQDRSNLTQEASSNSFDRYSLEHALWLMYKYAQHWSQKENFKPYVHKGQKMLEQFLEVPLTPQISFCGTFDGLIQNGAPAILEHKTSGSFRNFSQKAVLSLQGTGYVFLAQSLGIDVNQVLFNGLKTAWGRNDKTLFNNPEKNFTRIAIQVPKWKLEEFKQIILADAQKIIQDIESGVFTMSAPNACLTFGSCKFQDTCMAKPCDRELILKASFQKMPWKGFNVDL